MTKFCMVVANVYSVITEPLCLKYKNEYKYTQTGQKVLDNSGIQRPIRDWESKEWNLFHVTLLALSIWK
jgi:hypothetical protein